ncbi:hypothetical protein EDEG_03517 [Edhazardia aedis USNM 41457]|uniref:Major facilitator superfamily associated domain-containing protein n=1 Tax=Edhazardia aedis (strain USNM 41457) TaxID=1003232 RepID=J8ZQP2_EDHAE|nr:hypothetical protein EDEG_03517 [Edhazardia aedis USNM 41457]|eukprot:EJW02033.1 hypothetical protein EDEG_03517 [Edhazardia aedis USNM 41457]
MIESYQILYLYLAVRHFVPITTFLTPYLIEKKKFTNKEVFNKITHFFFIASLFASMYGPIIIKGIGNMNVMLLETFLEIVNCFILYFMGDRMLRDARIVSIFHGTASSFTTIGKGILLELKPPHKADKDMIAANGLIKRIGGVLSSWIGQDLKYSTGEHQANLLFSLFMLVLSFGIGLFVPSKYKSGGANLFEFFTSKESLETLMDIYNGRVIFFCLLNIIGSTLYICFAIYSVSIFIERKKDVDPGVNFIGKWLYALSYPMRAISWSIVKMLSIFDRSLVYAPKYDKDTVIFGYIDGLAKLMAGLSGYIISKCAKKVVVYRHGCMICIILVMVLTYSMGATRSLLQSYLIFIVCAACSQVGLNWSSVGFSKNNEQLVSLIMGINLLISSIIHISISYYSKYMNYNATNKMLLYFYINSCLLIMAGSLYFIADFEI